MHSVVRILALVLLCAGVAAYLATPQDAGAGPPPITYIVDTTADDPLATMTTCDNPNLSIDCSLAGAMTGANNHASSQPDVINFDIGGVPPFVITPSIPLPDITAPLILDGSACILVAGSSPCIRIDGVNVPGHAGLKTTADNVTIRGLSIYNVTGWSGIEINGENSLVEQTFLGTPNGVTVAPNGSGINVLGNNNTIGSAVPGKHNLVSGNKTDGIGIYGNGNTVIGNWTGVGFSGTTSMANDITGIYVYGSNNTIGGLAQGEGNTASGNTGGVFAGGVGIALVGQGNTAIGNFVGTDATGTFEIANGSGIIVLGDLNTVGGADPGARNFISGNTIGVYLAGEDGTTSGIKVQGNTIGLNADGLAVPNGTGVQLTSGGSDPGLTEVTIGGDDTGEGNVISGNLGHGIVIEGTNTTGNTIAGNFIGTHPTGIVSRANGFTGIVLSTDTLGDVSNNTISSNLVSGNGLDGILLNGPGTHSNTIDSNKIGTDVTGAGLLHNAGDGVEIEEGAHDNILQLNVITAGTTGIGVTIGDTLTNASNNSLYGNHIGTNENGDVLGAGQFGIFVDSATGTKIGSDLAPTSVDGAHPAASAPSGNVIAYAVSNGIEITGATATGNRISGNSIYNNGGQGIDLSLDANDDQDPPVLSEAWSGSTTVVGTLTAAPNEAFRIQLFASPACDPSGRGEGKDYLGAFSVLTSEAGVAQIHGTVAGTTPPGSVVTATATDDDGNTSEFSSCVTVAPGQRGDADCDEEVDMDDVIAVLTEYAGLSPGASCPLLADADCDQDVDPIDALRIARMVAEVPLPPALPCEAPD